MQGLVHLPRRRQREEVQHVLLEQGRHGGHGDGRAQGADHGEYLVLLHQLLGGEQALLRIVAAVLQHQLQLAAVDAAGFVDLVDTHHHAEAQLLPEARQGSGQVLQGPDDHLVLGDAHLLGAREGHAGGEGGREGQGGQAGCDAFHGVTSVSCDTWIR